MASTSSQHASTSGKKWFFELQTNKGLLVYRWLGNTSKEWTRSSGDSYGLVTGIKEPTEEAMQKVRTQKSDASAEKYLQVFCMSFPCTNC